MMCEICGKRKAVVMIETLDDSGSTYLSLCLECDAERRGEAKPMTSEELQDAYENAVA